MTGYIRGAAGTTTDTVRVLRVAVVAVLLALAALTAVLTANAVSEYARADRLHRHGVAVPATISSCVGLASGTGITVAGYRCTARFTLDGHEHQATLQHNATAHSVGSVITAYVDSTDAANLSAQVPATPSASVFVAASISAVVLVVCLALITWIYLRRASARRRSSS